MKSVGESVAALKAIKNVLSSFEGRSLVIKELKSAMSSYSVETVKSAIAQSTLNEEQIRAILIEKGLTGQLLETTTAELAQATTTNALAVSEGVATTATVGLGNAFKGLGASMKTFALSHPVLLAIAAVGVTVYGVVKAYDALTVSVEEANEAMQDAVGEYDSAKSSLESVNTELEEQNKKMNELLAKDKLTYAEKGQLEELQAITQELLLQQDIEEKRADKASKDVADKTVDAYKKQYGKYDKSEDYLKELLTYENMPILDDAYNVFGIVAAYIRAQKLLEQSQKEFDDAVKNGNDTTWIAEDVQHNIDAVEDYRQALDDNISDLQEKRLALEDEYNKAVEKRQAGIEPLTSLDKDVIETYESIYDVMKTVYEYTDKNSWNNMEISNIFNTEGIEKTKEELISMYKSGELSSSEMLEQFPKLNQAIKESEIIAGEGSDAFKEFFNEIAALADETEDVVNGVSNNTSTLSITETIAQINTQLKPAFDSLKSAYQDIFTFDNDTGEKLFSLENVGIETFESVRSELDKLGEIDGITVDYSAFENFVAVLSDTSSTADEVQAQFDRLATNIIYTTDCTNISAETYDLLVRSLKNLGVTNAEDVLSGLKGIQEELVSAGYNLSDVTAEEAAKLVELGMVSAETVEYLNQYLIQKELSQNPLDTIADIQALENLCNALGITGELYQNVIALKDAFDAKERGAVSAGLDESIKHYQDRISELANGKSDYKFSFDGTATPKTSKKSGSSKKEEDKWLAEYKKKLAELQNLLAKGVINEREFFSQSEILLNTYLKDSEEHMTKYAEEISDAEKTLHSDRMNAYQYEADELFRLQNGNYLNMTEYYQSMIGLQDEYYNSEALKLKNLADTMEAQYGRMSHVTLTRPSVDASEIQSAGYTTELTSSSVYAQSFGDETKQVVLTPILPDGTVLSPEALTAYADKLLKGEKIDADIQLSMFEGKDAVKQTAEYINGLEKMQSEYQTLKKTFSESPYGDFTEEQLEAIEKLTEEIEKHKSQLTSELGDIKSAYDDLIEIRDTYNEYGKISVDQYQSLCDMGFEYLALLSNESGALSLDEDAFQRLTDAKIQQIQVDMALQATDLIKNIQTEEQAVQYLAASYENLAANALSAAEQMLYAAQANAHLMYGADSMQAQAANTIVKGYENAKLAAGVVDIKMQSGGGYEKPKEEEKQQEKTFDWIETLLEKISAKTGKIIDKIEKLYNWQKKNLMINRAVRATNGEIMQNQIAYQSYMKAANSVRLRADYVKKIQEGKLNIETLKYTDGDVNSGIIKKIEKYTEWYEKAQECLETINSLYDQQRDLIRQKLDNVLNYYSDMDSYLSSITSKMESLISLNDEMGKRSSLTELVEQFASLSDQINSTTQKEIAPGMTVTEGSLGDSKKVADAANRDRQELADSIQDKIDNLSPDQSGTYTKLLKDIAKTEAQIEKYRDKGWDVRKAKQFEKLTQKLADYYALQAELDEHATSDTIANYSRIYTAWQKLQNKIDSGKTLSKSEQKKYDSYEKQLEALKNSGQASLDRLYEQLAEAQGTAEKQSEADKLKDEISGVQKDLENTATYSNLISSIETVRNKLAALDEKGYDNLSKSQKKTYDKLRAQLESYYAQKEALDENATASNIAEYNKIYLAWKKLQDKLDKGGNLSVSEWKKYNAYTEQLEHYAKDKTDMLEKLNSDLTEALDPSDKLEQIEKTYEESAEGIYESYHSQIDSINNEAINTQQYQNLLAKAQKLEQKKDTKGLSKSEQAQLDKYNAELEALQKGATGNNISEYMKTWESWYKLQQKLDNGGRLSVNEAKKYDTYKAQLEAWNREKQTQINDLLSQMEDDLEQLQKTYTENVSEAESQVSDYYANLYQLAKQIAEYNLTTLKSQLEYLDSFIAYYKELVSLYDTFSGDKLTKLLTDLDENAVKTKVDTYGAYLDVLQEKYDTTLSEMNEYGQLLDALDANDFEASMDVFNKALESYRQSGDTAMADKLQSVLDLLNERAVDADNWGEFADQWAEEWEKEFASAKQELIGTANEIQNVNDALRNARFENITDAISELDTAKGILSSITDLIQDDWLYDNGELSEYGQAKVALLVSQLEDAHKKADAYLNLYNEIQNNKDTYASDKAYMEDLNNAIQNYYSTLGESATLENSIIELMKRSAQEELDSLNQIIDARKKALQKKKEYYDYDKTLKNSQKEIDGIKAQIAAIENLSGVMDAATKAKLAQLKADLAEKEDALQETKDEHTYTLQIDALDEFAASLEETLDNSTKSLAEILEEHSKLMGDAKDLYQTVGGSVNDTLDKIRDLYSGTGTVTGSTDTDLTPKETENSKSGNTAPSVNITLGSGSNETSSTNKSDTEDVNLIIKQNMIKAAELFEKYGDELLNPQRVFRVNDQNMLELVNRQFSVMAGTGQNIPDYVRNNNVQPVVNIHYDNMINVEGSVDKSFSKEFQENSDKMYKNFTDRLYNEAKLVTGRRPVRKSVL